MLKYIIIYYQKGEVTSSGEKRKNEIETDNDNKKLKVNEEVFKLILYCV